MVSLGINFSDLDKQLAALKTQWESTTDENLRNQLHEQANALRAQGANEALANLLSSGSILGAGVQYSQQYMGADYDPYKTFQEALKPTQQQPVAQTYAPPPMPKLTIPKMSKEALALLDEINARAQQAPVSTDQITQSQQYQDLVGVIESQRDEALRQTNAQLAARGVLGEGSTPAASRVGWVYQDAARRSGELVPQLIAAEEAQRQAAFQKLVSAFTARTGAENQLFQQGLAQFQAEMPYYYQTASQAAQLGESQRQFDASYGLQSLQLQNAIQQQKVDNAMNQLKVKMQMDDASFNQWLKRQQLAISQAAQRTDADYKDYIKKIGLDEADAKKATNAEIASIMNAKTAEEAYQYLVMYGEDMANEGVDMAALLKAVAQKFGGAGGGDDELWQMILDVYGGNDDE